MTSIGWLQIILFSLVILLITKPLGLYMAHVIEGDNIIGDHRPTLYRRLENLLYKLCGITVSEEMSWDRYTQSLIFFSLASCLFSYLILRGQGYLPFNPMHFSTHQAPDFATALTPDLAFNTAISFTTNTNWQSYAGETTLSYFSQMVALAFHNWVSAAAGISCAAVVIRGFARQKIKTIGNFWRDLIRITLYILFPIAFLYAILLVSQGVIQTFAPYLTVTTIEGSKQLIALGPVASQEAIKLLGTNGGGFFNANSAHPFENPTPLSNFMEMLSIFLIPAALTYTFGYLVKDTRQGWALLSAMFVLFFAGVTTCYALEGQGNPLIANQHIETDIKTLGDLGGNMEGKEVRFGLANSALFTTVTTDASCGAVNCMHDSLTPLAGMIPLINMQLGEVVFGGVGAGLYGIIIFAVLTVFIAGLMVGRTPEYLGKKIEEKEVKMAMLFVLAAAFSILLFTAIALVTKIPAGNFLNPPGAPINNINNTGPHGFSEILYAFSSGTANNGSAFAGLNTNTIFYNTLLGLAMMIGRFFMIVPVLALAGSLVNKKIIPASSGTFPTSGWLFVSLLIGVIALVGALTFFPALCLGPIVEYLLMNKQVLF